MSLSSNPSSFNGEEKRSTDSGLSTLLDANNLDSYVLPSALSVTVSRAHKKSYATANSFTTSNGNRTISMILKPGSDYVYGPDSMIMFDLNVTGLAGTDSCGWGRNGSVLNAFKSIRITHASGTEIEYVDSANLLNFFKVQYERSRTWRNTKGSAMGLAPFREFQEFGLSNYPVGSLFNSEGESLRTGEIAVRHENLRGVAQTHYAIPLSILSELFASDKLLPPYALAGMRIEIELESPQISLLNWTTGTGAPVAGSGVAPVITVSNIEVHLDSHTLTDSVQKALAKMSALEGLDLHFPSWFHDRHTMAGTTNTVNISKALSRVEDIKLIPRIADHFANTAEAMAFPSFASERYPTDTLYKTAIASWQIAIGSMFFPSHAVMTPQQSYFLAQQGLSTDNDISFQEFRENGLVCLRGNMERSQILNGSGIAISATRGATIHITSENAKVFDLFVKHTRLVSVFLDNVVVRT